MKHIKKPKAAWWVAFMDIQSISKRSPLIYEPRQEIHDKQVPKYFFCGFLEWLYIKNTLRNSLETDQMLTTNLAMKFEGKKLKNTQNFKDDLASAKNDPWMT